MSVRHLVDKVHIQIGYSQRRDIFDIILVNYNIQKEKCRETSTLTNQKLESLL